MNDAKGKIVDELVIANRILANEGVLDAFGHISMRHPEHPDNFLMSCSRAPKQVAFDDIIEYNANSEPITPPNQPLYIERYIHGSIYRARPDVHAICHHHAPQVMSFCVSGKPLIPVYQHGAMIGPHVPFWDSREHFGDTNLLIVNAEQGDSLANALGQNSMVLMRHHGATVVGTSLAELVFRSIAACKNAQFLHAGRVLGPVEGLTPGEIAMAGKVSPNAINRAWSYWSARLS